MQCKKRLSDDVKAQIIALSATGMTQVAIGQQLQLSQQVVSLTLRNYRERGSWCTAQRSGRPRATTDRTDNLIRRISTSHPTWSAKEISSELQCPPSVRTIQRRLHDKFHLTFYWLLRRENLDFSYFFFNTRNFWRQLYT